MKKFLLFCENCRVPSDAKLCSACDWLITHPYERNQPGSRGETAGFVNRRWQFYFNRGELRSQLRTQYLSDSGAAIKLAKRLRLLGYSISVGMNRNKQRGKFYYVRAWKGGQKARSELSQARIAG